MWRKGAIGSVTEPSPVLKEIKKSLKSLMLNEMKGAMASQKAAIQLSFQLLKRNERKAEAVKETTEHRS